MNFLEYGNRRLLLEILLKLHRMEKRIMAALDDLNAAVAAERTVEQSAITLIQGIATELAALVAASSGSVASADIEAVVATINANSAALADAVAANTLAATPAPSPAP